jgi:hypothetical protein
VYDLQFNCGVMLHALAGMRTDSQLQPAVRDQIALLLQDPATTELLLQLLTAQTVLLQRELDAEQQQLRSGSKDCSSSNASGVGPLGRQPKRSQCMHSPTAAQQHCGSKGDSSSSPSSSRQAPAQQRQAPKNQPSEVALAISALQNGMMQLLPVGAQQYVGAAAVLAAEQASRYANSRDKEVEQQITLACSLVDALFCGLELTLKTIHAGQQPCLNAPALQAAAVHLMLELQLVAAGLVQRQLQHGQKAAGDSFNLMGLCCQMLESQIRAVLPASGSNSLPPVLLQQTGLQLLRALAAPVQQLQLLLAHQQQHKGSTACTQAPHTINVDELCGGYLQWWSSAGSPIGQVLYVLGAAASGLADVADGKPVPVLLQRLGIDEVHAQLSKLRLVQW